MDLKGGTIELNNTKNEIVGIFDKNDNYIGKATRKEMRSKNLIHRATDIVVLNQKNEILVQTRSMKKEYCPGYLDATVGGVVGDGEDVYLSAKREVGEEIGIDIKNDNKLKYVLKYFFEEDISRCFSYEYYIKLTEDEVKSIVFRDNEVSSIEWYSKEKLIECFKDKNFKITNGSKQSILNLIKAGII